MFALDIGMCIVVVIGITNHRGAITFMDCTLQKRARLRA